MSLPTTIKGELREWRWLHDRDYIKGNFYRMNNVRRREPVIIRVAEVRDRIDYYLIYTFYGQGKYIAYKSEEIK